MMKMPSKLARYLMAVLLGPPAANSIWRRLSRQPSGWGRILIYHSVPDSAEGSFEAQLRFLKSNYNVVPLEEIVTGIQGGVVDNRRVAISFDDGFLDNYSNAFPLLQRHDIPATFFVSTDFIDASGDSQAESLFCIDRLRASEGAAMSWDHLKEMSRAGYSIASHSVSHAKLSQLPLPELMEQLSASKGRIEDALGVPCSYFAYPFGRLSDTDEASLAGIREAGYEACFSAVRGFNASGNGKFMFYRDNIVPSWSAATIRVIVEGCLDFRYRKPRAGLDKLGSLRHEMSN